MKNYLDGGDAVVEAIRKLGIDHIISSPGSEWAPVWEAMARQDHDKADGPNFIDTWHETLAVDMAVGYSLIIVFNNKRYAAMRGGCSSYYADGVAVTDDNLRGVHINGPDYAQLAPLFNGHGERVEDPGQLHGALERGLAAVNNGQFAILNVVVSR